MAQPVFTKVSTGDSLNAATWNSLFSDVVTQSGNVQASNLRDEGFDRNSVSLDTPSVHAMTTIDSRTAVSYGTAGGMDVDSTNWTLVTNAVSGESLRESNGGAGWTIDTTSQIAIVRASVQVRRTYDDNVVGFQIYKRRGGVESVLTYTYRLIEYDGSASDPWQQTEINISTVLYESGSYEWVELRTKAISGAFTAANEWYYLSEGAISIEIHER